MKLKSIKFENFRCFKKRKQEFHDRLTILTSCPGNRGATTILEGIKIAIAPFISGLLGDKSLLDLNIISPNDLSQFPNMPKKFTTKIKTKGLWPEKILHSPKTFSWELKAFSQELKINTHDENTITLYKAGKILKENFNKEIQNIEGKSRDLPLITYLSDFYLPKKSKKLLPLEGKRIAGYYDCLSLSSDFFIHFEKYWEKLLCLYWEKLVRNEPLPPCAENINVIKKAIDSVIKELTGWGNLSFSIAKNRQITLFHSKYGGMPLSMIESEVQDTVAKIIDIAFRCILLNPHYGGNVLTETRGVVLIDNFDSGLHPSLVAPILTSFCNTFPKIQFIVVIKSMYDAQSANGGDYFIN